MFRKTYIEVDLNKLTHNYNYINSLNAGKEMIAVVKANAYGHGMIEVTRHLNSIGVNVFAVATFDEAINLRSSFNDIEIMVLGTTPTDYFKIARDLNIIVSIHLESQLCEIIEGLKYQIVVNTGMNRLGFDNLEYILDICSKYHPIGIFTHFATGDLQDDLYFKQVELFNVLLNQLDLSKLKYIHANNSGASIYDSARKDLSTHIRVGIALYGLCPDKIDNNLLPVLSLYSEITQITKVKAGVSVGYGGKNLTSHDTYIATIQIGYGDGIIRANTRRNVSINNQCYQIFGNVCMDQLMIEVDETVQVGDVVELIGQNITADYIASYLNTINYEVVTLLSLRVIRTYIK